MEHDLSQYDIPPYHPSFNRDTRQCYPSLSVITKYTIVRQMVTIHTLSFVTFPTHAQTAILRIR